jgi:Cdc6-like AAA superfamily ATPase
MSLTNIVDKKIDSVRETIQVMQHEASSMRNDFQADRMDQWLRPPDPSTNANHARRLHHKGTGLWVLKHPVFQSWDSGSHQHLWLYGLAGCGKTVLSTVVLDHILKDRDRHVLYYYFDFSDGAKQTVDRMLRSLASQLYHRTSVSRKHLDALFETYHNGRSQPSIEALSDVLCKVLSGASRVHILLDALDESTTRDELLSWMETVASAPELERVHLVFTSRHEKEFRRRIPQFMGADYCLELDKEAVDEDIQSYIAAELAQRRDFRDKRLPQDLLQLIQDKVGGGASGM